MYILSRVTKLGTGQNWVQAEIGHKPSRVTSRPPDLRSTGSANLDH